MTDPIADFLTRIRNAIMARKTSLELPSSKLKRRVAEVLREEGYLSAVQEAQEAASAEGQKAAGNGVLSVVLRWDAQNRPAITGIRRISRPGQRMYVPKDKIRRVRGGLGIAVLTTSKGVMTDREARNLGVGGEVICEVW